jgi:DNA-binding GntR family transcriptional regulator
MGLDSALSDVTRQPSTKADAAYVHIRRAILEGQLAPGSLLDQELLATTLGLSTTPVREALRRLEMERLVLSRAHRDTIVAPLSLGLLEETYALRLVLDPMAAALSAKHMPDEQAQGLLTLIAGESAPMPIVEQMHLNRRFHRAIYSACANSVLVSQLESLWDMTDRYRLVTLKQVGTSEVARAEHQEIAELVISRNPEAVHALMEKHVSDSLQRIREGVTDASVEQE